MICPTCSNQFDIYSAIIAEDKENEGKWICPDCKTPLNDSDANPPLLFRDKIRQSIIDIIGEDRPFMSVPDIAEEITQNVMGIVEQNTQGACKYCGKPGNSPNYAYHICASTRKEVVVTVTGGVADVEEVPPEIIVKIRDYDIEGYDEDKLIQDLIQDKEGNRYIETIFTGDDASCIGDGDDGDPH